LKHFINNISNKLKFGATNLNQYPILRPFDKGSIEKNGFNLFHLNNHIHSVFGAKTFYEEKNIFHPPEFPRMKYFQIYPGGT